MTQEVPYFGTVLRLCATLSVSLGFVGIVLYAAIGANADVGVPLGDIFRGLLSLDPASVMSISIIALVASPFIWVATALIAFILNKNAFYACLGCIILLLMGAALVLTS